MPRPPAVHNPECLSIRRFPVILQLELFASAVVPNKSRSNPFYIVLVIAGVAFGITALAYGAMAAIAQNNPAMARAAIDSGHGLVAVMDRYGFHCLLIELVVLAFATILAITTDQYWSVPTQASEEANPADRDDAIHAQEQPHESEPLRAD